VERERERERGAEKHQTTSVLVRSIRKRDELIVPYCQHTDRDFYKMNNAKEKASERKGK